MKKRIIAAIGLFSMIFISQAVWVQAAEKPKISVEVADYNSAERTLNVNCTIGNGDNVTNGKLRIFYDAEKVTLTSDKAGEALSGAMLEVNNCLTGNKPEGEMVAAFASAQSVPSDGSLLDMGFKLKDNVKEGDKITFQVKAEKLSGENGDLVTDTPEIIYTVGEEQEAKPGGQEEKPGGQDKENGSKTDNEKESSPENGGKGSSDKESIKTGDKTEVVLYLILGCGAAVVLLGCILEKKKK